MRVDRICLNCKAIIKGRTDKKFCDDHCRSSYNYRHTGADHLNFVRSVNRTLRRNRNILKILHKHGPTKVSKKSLVDRGFDFRYHTNLQAISKYSVYFCYDMCYHLLDDHEALIINRETTASK